MQLTPTVLRRQLQTAATLDMSTAAFRDSMASALVLGLPAALGVTADNLIVTPNLDDYTVLVQIINVEYLDVDTTSLISSISEPSFTETVATSVGVPVTIIKAPRTSFRIAPVPSPPPSPWSPIVSISALASSTSALSDGDSESESGLNQTHIWVIIVSVLVAVVFLGCVSAYCYGKRTAKGKARGGASYPAGIVGPASVSHSHLPPLPVSSFGSMAHFGAESRAAQDARLIGLGMALERQNSVGGSPGGRGPVLNRPPSDEEVAMAQQQLVAATQAALSVAAQLSPRASGRTSPDARIAATSWLDSAVANAITPSTSVESSPRSAGHNDRASRRDERRGVVRASEASLNRI